MKIKIFLTVLLWIGLPALFYSYFLYISPAGVSQQSGLLVMYIGFSWAIALLAFSVETSRQKLVGTGNPFRAGMRLGGYGMLAMLIAILTSPWLDMTKITDIAWLLGLGWGYCSCMGWAYARLSCVSTNLQD